MNETIQIQTNTTLEDSAAQELSENEAFQEYLRRRQEELRQERTIETELEDIQTELGDIARELEDTARARELEEAARVNHLTNVNLTSTLTAALPPLETITKKIDISGMPSFDSLQAVKKVGENFKKETTEVEIPLSTRKKKIKKNLQLKRVKKAASLTSLENSYGGSMFYRYVRILDKNIKEGKRKYIGPYGGACLLLNYMNDVVVRFSFSICNEKDKFIKDEAKIICQRRFHGGVFAMMSDLDKTSSFFDNFVRACENAFFNLNKEPSEPKLTFETSKINPINLKKLYRLIKQQIQTGENLCLEKI